MNFLTEVLQNAKKGFIYNQFLNTQPIENRLGAPSTKNARGIMVYNEQQIVPVSGIRKDGQFQSGMVEYPLFRITIQQRIEFAKMCAPLHGLISSRMQRIAKTSYQIVPVKKEEDRMYDQIKMLYELAKEYAKIDPNNEDDADYLEFVGVRERAKAELKKRLPDMLPDMSNFPSALRRWKRRIQNVIQDRGAEIKDWLEKPNNGLSFMDFRKKMVFDLHVHGTSAVYKQFEDGKLARFDCLPGGSVFKMKNRYFSPEAVYIQMVQGLENQIFNLDEIAYLDYLPISSQNYGLIPLESILNKMICYLLHDLEMAQQADGTRPPEKLLAVSKKTDRGLNFDVPPNLRMDSDQQAQLEAKINEPKRYPVIVVDTLNGDLMEVIDIGKENLMTILDQRQDMIKQDVSMIFNAMPLEMGLTGSDFTSGRENSEEQSDISHGKGMGPILHLTDDFITTQILPYRYGFGYMMLSETAKDDKEQRELDALRLKNGEVTVNELREEKGLPIFEGDAFNLPQGMGGGEIGDAEHNPLHIKDVGNE